MPQARYAESAAAPVEQSRQGVHQSARDRGHCKKMTGTDDVGKICQRTQKRAGYETKLDREREPTCRCFAEIPFLRQRRHYSRAAEPKRHAEQFGNRQHSQRAPA